MRGLRRVVLKATEAVRILDEILADKRADIDTIAARRACQPRCRAATGRAQHGGKEGARMSETLECPTCEAPVFTADAYGYFHEDDETTCACGARLVVNMDEGTDCDCDDGECGACDEWGQVHYAHVAVIEESAA